MLFVSAVAVVAVLVGGELAARSLDDSLADTVAVPAVISDAPQQHPEAGWRPAQASRRSRASSCRSRSIAGPTCVTKR